MSSDKPVTIKKFPKYSETTDYLDLVSSYTDSCQNYSSKTWTDYNIHDPGVTILELLCLAITEVGLKSELDIFRIIFNSKRLTFQPEEYALYSPLEVFPTHAITIEDYRKSILDKFITEVDNVWIEPLSFTEQGVGYKGLINILVKPKIDAEKNSLKNSILKYFNSTKNIGEDISGVVLLEPAIVTINLDAMITGNILPEEILAELRQLLYTEIEKPIIFEGYLTKLQKGEKIEDVLSGPFLENGKINDQSLINSNLEKINTLYKSQLLNTITNSPYIEKIEKIEIKVNGEAVNSDHIVFDKYTYPRFDFHESNFNLYKDNNLLAINKETQEYIYKSTYKTRNIYSQRSLEEYLRPDLTSNISISDINTFYSIQNQFPKIYGITEYGVTSKLREYKTSSLQLKAYLSFFEQIFQNYLEQLSNVDKLFSLKRINDPTYFTAFPDGIPEFDKVINVEEERFASEIQDISDNFDDKYKRRNEFINHICARFGEEFPQNIYSDHDLKISNDNHSKHLKEISLKSIYLQNYAALSMNRSKSSMMNTTLLSDLSSFHIKLLILLGIENFIPRTITQFSGLIKKGSKNKLTLELKSNEDVQDVFTSIIDETSYTIENVKGKYILSFNAGGDKPQKIMESSKYTDCENAMDEIRENGIRINEHSEYFYMIENIMLRPEKEGLTSDDPYSNVCTIILPDWPYRFQQTSFQNNFNNLVTVHTPIHIKFLVYYLPYSEMITFEKLQSDLEGAGTKAVRETAKKKLADFLLSLKE